MKDSTILKSREFLEFAKARLEHHFQNNCPLPDFPDFPDYPQYANNPKRSIELVIW